MATEAPSILSLHFTPVHCSWPPAQNTSPRQTSQTSIPLEQLLLAFIAEWNESAHPCAWIAKSFDEILTKADTIIAAAAWKPAF